ncbi:MAG: tetratricopeptide repeat protein [Myxococcota bacterium]|jgi:tetratricopeptide (TPR) repeat protein|nr:tetratricopeptide repeat protein [Myxococcota bacterium]
MTGTWVLLAQLVPASLAERDLQDYRAATLASAETRVEELNARGRYDQAKEFGLAFLDGVGESARLHYEVGHAFHRTGELQDAREQYDEAIRLEDSLAEAWYDRGEVSLLQEEYDDALHDFGVVVDLRPNHWAGYFRLAELAARATDLQEFERCLALALHHGFTFELILSDARWIGWAQEPEIGAVIERLASLSGQEQWLLKMLTEPQTPQE